MTPYKKNNISIIPHPQSIELKKGKFSLENSTKILAHHNMIKLARFLKQLILPATGFNLEINKIQQKTSNGNNIDLVFDKKNKDIPLEGYRLNVSQDKIEILGSTYQGIFYGIQSLRQLFPPTIETSTHIESNWKIPCLIIKDNPRFSWRGLMLDESRYFFGKQTVKKLLDIMSSLKLNIFHWHLTDDPGWRIEIKKYPRLIEIGSKREGTVKFKIGFDGIPVSGYYTQKDLKEIISYASERFITIIPEIDMPGHILSALAAYPQLSCRGRKLEVPTYFSVFKEILCVGKEKVFEFVENVLKEVMDLFPSNIIHTGGDEVPKTRWKRCKDCKKRVKQEKLNSIEELHPYFTNRIAKFINSHNHRLIGWNEILNDNLPKSVICQFWKGDYDELIKHIRNGRDVIISEEKKLYLDFPYSATNLKDTYEYDPIPEGLEKKYHKHILGIEGCIWTEFISDIERLEFQAYPRTIAIAETGWSSKHHKDFQSFSVRLDSFLRRLEFQNINFASKNENNGEIECSRREW
jgi:hexosaminidase